MTRKTLLLCVWGLAWIGVLAATATAGSSDAVGSLVGSRNATLDGHAPLPHTVLLSGDKVAVNNGLAMLTLERGNRMILGRDSEAVLLREADRLTVRMARGSLSLYHSQDGSRLRVEAGDVVVAPAGGPGTLGEITLSDGLLVVTAKAGSLNVQKEGAAREVEEGHSLTVAATADRTPKVVGPVFPATGSGLGHGTAVAAAAASGGAGVTLASVALTRSGQQVSPATPGP